MRGHGEGLGSGKFQARNDQVVDGYLDPSTRDFKLGFRPGLKIEIRGLIVERWRRGMHKVQAASLIKH